MIKRVKDVVISIGSGTTPKSGEARYYDNGNIPWLNSGDLNDGLVTTTAKTITQEAVEEFSALHFYPKESVVVAMYGASIGNTGIIDFETTVNQACCVLIPDKGQISPYFLQLLLKLAKPKFLLESFGGTQPNISQKIVANMLIDVPPVAEQEAIAAYLDKECEKIGREIELLERKADGYRRLRRSLINRAVTRGLNPNAPLKPSGNDWIGDIPAYWSVEPLRRFLTLISPERKGDSDLQLLSVTRDKGVIIRGAKGEDGNNNRIPDDLSDYKIVHRNQFVVNKMKAWMGSYGVSQYDGIVSPAYYICDVHNIFEPFLSVAIRCKMYTNFFWKYSKGIRVDQWDMSPLALREIPFVTPPITEQREIVAYLDEKCAKIGAIVEKIETKIERLKELKRSLINEVVTGQRAINTK